MQAFEWSHLNHMQVGRFGESFVKLELTRLGCDVYTSDVDDRGIDFVVRIDHCSYRDIQVKTVRGYNYVFVRKSVFPDYRNLYLAVVVLLELHPPLLYMIPRTRWLTPDQVFVARAYENAASDPEFGINLSTKNIPALAEVTIDRVACSWSRP